MTLRAKTLTISGLCLLGLMAGLYALTLQITTANLSRLEEASVQKDVNRTREAISESADKLNMALSAWSQWDDTCAYMRDKNRAYERNNLTDAAISVLRVDAFLLLQTSGRVRFATGYDSKNKMQNALPVGLLANLQAGSRLLHHNYNSSNHMEIVLLGQRAMLLVARPIVKTSGKGAIYGTAVLARFIDAEVVRHLENVTHNRLSFVPLAGAALPSDFQIASQNLSPRKTIFVRPRNTETVSGYTVLPDVFGHPALLLRTDVSRDIFQQGELGIRALLGSLLVAGLGFAAINMFLLERLVLSRVARLNARVIDLTTSSSKMTSASSKMASALIAPRENLSRRLPLEGDDELAQFAEAINGLLAAQETFDDDLGASEERLRRSLMDAPFPIMIHAEDGEILQINHVWTKITGYRTDEIPTLADWMLRAYSSSEPSLRGPSPLSYDLDAPVQEGETTIQTARGEKRLWDFTATPLGVLPDGRRILMSAANDVTARKRAEAELEQTKNQAEQSRDEAELARDEAQRANLAKSEFLSRMSHELRTPLNAILGFGQILDRQNLTPLQKESVGYILQGGRHLLALINEVLDIARIEAGQLSVSLEPVSLGEVAGEVLKLAQPLAEPHQIRFENVTSEHPCHVIADRQRLKQVILNLVSNAVKYNCEGGLVRVSCAHRSDGKVRFEVSDTGYGLSQEEIAKLFVPFERLGADLKGIDGTGIGLTICQRLMALMQGEIGVQSVENRGSTFWFELPGTQELIPEPTPDQSAVPVMEPATRGTVLYIEDNPSNLKLVELILASHPKISLLSAMQGQCGLEIARDQQPDLILLDLHLPDIDGDEVLRLLRAHEKTRQIPVVMISADATPAQIAKLLAAGANDYMTKPLDIAQFLKIIEKTLDT